MVKSPVLSTSRLKHGVVSQRVDPVEKIMSQFSEDAVYEDGLRHGIQSVSFIDTWWKEIDHADSNLYFFEMDMFDDVCEDLTREDPSFVGWEAIKRQGKPKIIQDLW